MQGHNVLIVYKETVPRSKSYRDAIKDKENIQLCVARPFDDIDEALHIYNILFSLKHPNLLGRPIRLWKCCGDGLSLENKAKVGKGENSDVKAEEPKKEVIAYEVKPKQEVNAHEVKPKQEVIAHGVKPKQEVIAEKVKIKAFIMLPAFDGALVDFRREEIFLVEDNNSPQADAYGFTRLGSKLFRDIVDVAKYINGQ